MLSIRKLFTVKTLLGIDLGVGYLTSLRFIGKIGLSEILKLNMQVCDQAKKLYEELLIGGNVSETENPLIMRAKEDMRTWKS